LEIEFFEVLEFTVGAIVFVGEDVLVVLYAWCHWVIIFIDDIFIFFAL